METLKVLLKRFVPDAGNVIFVIIFVTASLALWGFFHEPAATEGVSRRQFYFILILAIAGLALAGTVYFKYFALDTPGQTTKTQVCPLCGGMGRAKYRPEYPCGNCDGTGYITP